MHHHPVQLHVMPPHRLLVAFALLTATAVPRAGAQAPVGLLPLSVRHSTLKNTARPTGELKALVDSLDAQIAAAAQLGRTSDIRRLYAHAATVLARRPWTPEAEFASSLVSRTDRQVADLARRWSMQVEQIYAPAIPLERPLVARATLRQRAAGGTPIEIPQVVARHKGTMLGELDTEAFLGRAVHARHEAVDDPVGDELEVAEGRQNGGVELIGAWRRHECEA